MAGANKSGSTTGRPRDEALGPALLEATRRLVIEHGYSGVSVGMIATEAQVARQTLYRRWASKAELVLDAFLESVAQADTPGDEPIEEALQRFLAGIFEHLRRDGVAIRNLIASTQEDAAFLDVFRVRFIEPRERIVLLLLERAVARGELPPRADVDLAVTALHGTFWYRLLLRSDLDDAYAARLARFLVDGLRGAEASPKARRR